MFAFILKKPQLLCGPVLSPVGVLTIHHWKNYNQGQFTTSSHHSVTIRIDFERGTIQAVCVWVWVHACIHMYLHARVCVWLRERERFSVMNIKQQHILIPPVFTCLGFLWLAVSWPVMKCPVFSCPTPSKTCCMYSQSCQLLVTTVGITVWSAVLFPCFSQSEEGKTDKCPATKRRI